MRNPMLSRYYIQCDLEAKPEDWPERPVLGGFQGAVSEGHGGK